ncbi:hypothetical protein [Sedimentibacter sp. MB31-C6]|uniref:hypothetical protein n=1 Tax=Sedimentibacter sp. MB31-C6 TaxID=3109366 RepID=UPI002DDDB50E|nr:hypothetical protein [Sedimentibacter sp. MB36-C1]WSI05111.1 hypothetical protein U8307_04780 [Sedimentibacter sp. MB36-C1]
MTLYDKLNKQKEIKEKLLLKKDKLNEQIGQVDKKIKLIQEDIENLELNNTMKVIKSKGYSLSDVRDAIEMGALEDILNK